MTDKRQVDVLVVGNGALGLMLANELAARGGRSLAVSGPDTRETGASQAAGAMLGCFGEVTGETFRSPLGRTKFELGLLARRRWPALLDELSAEAAEAGIALNVVDDSYVILNTRGSSLDSTNFDAIIDAAEKYGEPWEEVEATAIPAYRPRPDSRALRALHFPEEGAVDARAVLAVIQRRAENAGVAMVPEVAELVTSGDAVTGARLTDGCLVEAGTTVIATGAKSAPLLDSVLRPGEVMPTFAGLGFSMVGVRTRGEGFGSVVRTPNRAFACGLHLVPLGDGREYLGATNMVVGNASGRAVLGDVHFLADCAMRQLDEQIYHHEVAEYRVGNRPVSLDGFPLIGWARSGLYLFTGTYRDGFHNSPLFAEHVADELTGDSGSLGEVFAPGRAPVSTRSVEVSIDDFVEHRMAAWFEAGGQTPPNTSATDLAAILREQAATFYGRLNLTAGLGPDVLMHLLGSLRDPRTAAVLKYLRDAETAVSTVG